MSRIIDEGLKLKDLGRLSRPRNLLLFSIMARMDLVEHIGSGIKRIREAIRAYGLKSPVIEADADWFSITFTRKPPHEAIKKHRQKNKVDTPSAEREGVSEGISEGAKRLLEFIRSHPGLRTPQISESLGVPVKTLERWIKQLRVQEKIEFRGSTKTGGYWELKE